MDMKKVYFNYIKRKDGSSEFEDFLGKLPPKEAIKLLATIQKIETYGLSVAIKMKWVKVTIQRDVS